MEKTLLVLGVVALLGASFYMLNNTETQTEVSDSQSDAIPSQVYDLYNDWKQKNNRKYASQQEEQYRLSVFYGNYKYIQAQYEGPEQTYTLDFTQFMDLTNEEFSATYLGYIYIPDQEEPLLQEVDLTDIPNSVDWVKAGQVTPVKNQGQCGSCWSFSSTGALEGLSVRNNQGLQSFSEQQLVDCDTKDSGCNGGIMDNTFQWTAANGITTEASYAYTARKGTCKTKTGAFKNKGYTPIRDCNTLKSKLAVGPVSVAVDANNWQFYSSGVFNNCKTSLDHGVLAVGYDDAGNWVVKNSWGPTWGESGYIRVAAGNTCGICQQASQPY